MSIVYLILNEYCWRTTLINIYLILSYEYLTMLKYVIFDNLRHFGINYLFIYLMNLK